MKVWPENERIGEVEIVILVASNLIGAGIISLPATLADIAGPDAWMSLLIAWGFGLLSTFAIAQVTRRFPRQSLVQMLEGAWGTVLARATGFVYAIYLLILVSATVRKVADHIKTTLLPNTPVDLLILSLLLLAIYVAREGLEPISRMLTVLFPLIFFPLLIILLALKNAETGNLLPMMAQGVSPIFQGAMLATFSFLGFEGLFVWTAAMRRPERVTRPAMIGISIAGLVYLCIVFVTSALFKPTQAANLVVPLKSITDTIDLPFVIFERFDIVIFAIWITVAFTTLLLMAHLASRFLQDACGFRSHTPLLLPLLPITFVTALVPANSVSLADYVKYFSAMGLILAYAFPLFLWAWFAFKKPKNQR